LGADAAIVCGESASDSGGRSCEKKLYMVLFSPWTIGSEDKLIRAVDKGFKGVCKPPGRPRDDSANYRLQPTAGFTIGALPVIPLWLMA
jgi:hypothetical protein